MSFEDVPSTEFPLPSAPLVGDGVILRLWEPEDASWYVRSRDTEVFKWTTESKDLTVQEAHAAIENYREHPIHAGFAIVDRQTDQLIGNIALVMKETSGRTGEISYWLAPEGRGHGAATAAVRLLTSWGFETLPRLDRIELKMHPENSASRRVAERAGFARESLLRREPRTNGTFKSIAVYFISRESDS